MESLRLFVALELPDSVRAVCVALQRMLAAKHIAVRWVDPESMHLTLKFLGSVPRDEVDMVAAAMQDATRGHAPFTMRTNGLGAFPRPEQARVVWLGIAGDLAMLHALQQDVERSIVPLGYPAEQRAFNPHLTLGRTHKQGTARDRQDIGRAIDAVPPPEPLVWQVDTVSLMRSELNPRGATYTRLVRHGLTAPQRLL